MSEFYLYKLGTQVPASGFLIVVVDGTYSMACSYPQLLTAYKKVFKERIQNNTIYTIQFGNNITEIEPFQQSDLGNFNDAFQDVIQKISQIAFQNITICVISDGHADINFDNLRKEVQKIDKRKQIQFTSIAIGLEYPLINFSTFRELFHNGTPSCTNLQLIANGWPTENAERDAQIAEFIQAFQIVESQVNQQSKVILTQPASSTLQGEHKVEFNQGEIVYSSHPQVQTTNGQKIEQTSKPEDVEQIFKTSMQELIKDETNNGFTSVTSQGQQIKHVAQALVQGMEKSDQFTTGKIAKDLITLDKIVQGDLKLENLKVAQITQLLSTFNPKLDEELQQKQKEEFEQLDIFVSEGVQIFKDQDIQKVNFWPEETQVRCSNLYARVRQSDSEILISRLNQLQYDIKILDQIEQGKLDLNSLSDSDMKELSKCFSLHIQTKEEQQQQVISILENLIKQKGDVRDQWISLFLLDETIDISNSHDAYEIFTYILNLKDWSMQKLQNQYDY